MIKRASGALLAAAILVSANLPGCASIEKRKLIKKCIIRLESVDIKKFSLTDLTIGLTLGIANPNKMDVVMDRMDLDFYIDDKKTVNVLFNEVTIPPDQMKRVDAAVSIPYSTIGMSLTDAMKEKGVIRYRLAGKIYLKTMLGEIMFPVTVYKN